MDRNPKTERDATQASVVPRAAYPTQRGEKGKGVFAQRFLRLLAKTCAAQAIGTDAAWLLTVIVTLEDAARYRRGITFYNEQLMPILGFTRWHRLDAARDAAVDGGWLHYEPPPRGKRRVPGVYWVLVPASASELPDGPCDEGQPSTESVDSHDLASTESVDTGAAEASTENVVSRADTGVDTCVDRCVEPPCPSPNSLSPPSLADWAAAVERYRGRIAIVADLANEAKQQGRTAAEFCTVVDDALATAALQVNAGKLTTPIGAVVVAVRSGAWPPGIVTLKDHQRQLAERDAAEERRRQQRRRDAEQDAQRAAELKERAALESRCGEHLDALDDESLQALAECAGLKWPLWPNKKFMRLELLRAFNRQSQPEPMEAA